MQDRRTLTAQERDVWTRLDRVNDPELDEPLTDLGFIEAVSVRDGGDVLVCFRLPTYWCSPNFAFLMAEGIRDEVGALPWVTRVGVRLEDHMCADEMNDAVNQGRTFAEALALRPDLGDLTEVREKFDGKAFQRRQEAVLLGLKRAGFKPADVASMTLGKLDLVGFDDPEAARQLPRYREVLVRRGLATAPDDHAFPDLEGTPLTAESHSERMGTLRGVRINMEFGSALCRGLKETRYKEVAQVDGEPTLVDFLLERVPARTPAD
jgi:metal-sulfur cluster biosynthetic enzyme